MLKTPPPIATDHIDSMINYHIITHIMLNTLLTTTTRITITLPTYVHQQLVAQVPKGEVSQFVTYSLEKTLLETKTRNRDPVDQLFEHAAPILQRLILKLANYVLKIE